MLVVAINGQVVWHIHVVIMWSIGGCRMQIEPGKNVHCLSGVSLSQNNRSRGKKVEIDRIITQ
jgi:hypothetical protein